MFDPSSMYGAAPTETEDTKKTKENAGRPTAEWKTVSDPKQAGLLFSQELLHSHKDSKSLYLSMDIRQDREDQDRALVTFYKRDDVQWASPLTCDLKGDVATGNGVNNHMISTVIFKLISGFYFNLGSVAITQVFEGEPDHLIPSASDVLVDNDMFAIAGRMMGHSFLHGGPSFPGLSPAIIHVLFGGSIETAAVTIEDCPDIDLRDTIRTLDVEAELIELDSVLQLCRSWNLPPPNATNRKWLYEKLLLHAVIGRTMRQINQFRKGLKETGLWPLLTHRRDIIPILFPRESEAQVTPQMVLDSVIWPSSITIIYEIYQAKEYDETEAQDVCRISGYLRKFIENASSDELKSLLKFWIGWEVPAKEMKVEIVEAALPTSSTCFERLRLPRHYTSYKIFQEELAACISTSYSGFGCA